MSDMKKNIHTYQQEGFVSIIVTMFIMIVLTLIVLGFAQLARREQRQALDRQLSTQALFAAESGVNDAINKVKTGYALDINTCDTLPPGFNPNLSATTSYSCLLLKQKQETLLYDSVGTDSSTYVPIDSDTALTSITIGWGKTASNTSNSPVPLATKFPPVSGWTGSDLGVLRVDIVPDDPSLTGGVLVVNNFKTAANNKTYFFYPSSGSSNAPVVNNISPSGTIVEGACGAAGPTPQPCNVKINGLSGTKYFIRLKSIYKPSSVVVCANTCGAAGTTTLLSGAQLSIDVTGKANDVIKRISVRAPAPVTNTTPGSLPEFALDSMDSICKLLTVMPDPAPAAIAAGATNQSSFGTCP